MSTYDDGPWVTAATDYEAERHFALISTAMVEAAPILAFVVASESSEDFSNRLALMEDRLHTVASVVAGQGTPDYATIIGALPQRFFEQWQTAFAARQAAIQAQNAPRAAARAEARTAATQGQFDADLAKYQDALESGGWIEQGSDPDGTSFAYIKPGAPPDLVRGYQRLMEYGYANGLVASRRHAAPIEGIDCPGGFVKGDFSYGDKGKCPECGKEVPVSPALGRFFEDDGTPYTGGYTFVHLLPGKTLDDRIRHDHGASLKTAVERVADGWCCTDCLMLIANGDTSGWAGTETEMQEWLAEIDRRSEGINWVPGDDEREFSRSQCDVCGSTLAGYRHEVIGLGTTASKTAADPKSLTKGDRVWWHGDDDKVFKGTYVGRATSGAAAGFTQSDPVEVEKDGGGTITVGAQDLVKGEPPREAAREDYQHHNEDADRIWWEEEGRHGGDSGTYYCDICGYEHAGPCPMDSYEASLSGGATWPWEQHTAADDSTSWPPKEDEEKKAGDPEAPPAAPGAPQDPTQAQPMQNAGGTAGAVKQGDVLLDAADGTAHSYEVTQVTDQGDSVLLAVTKDGGEQMQLQIPKVEQVQVLPTPGGTPDQPIAPPEQAPAAPGAPADPANPEVPAAAAPADPSDPAARPDNPFAKADSGADKKVDSETDKNPPETENDQASEGAPEDNPEDKPEDKDDDKKKPPFPKASHIDLGNGLVAILPGAPSMRGTSRMASARSMQKRSSMPSIPGLPQGVADYLRDEDWYDEWGATMSSLWGVAEVMAAKGERAPVDHSFGAGGAPTEDQIANDDSGEHFMAQGLLEGLNRGDFTMADLEAATRALDAYADELKAQGKDY